MDKANHKMTGSYAGGRGSAKDIYRNTQKELIDNGNYRGAFEMDMKDLRSQFGEKYEKRIRKAAKYAAKEGLL